MASTRFWGTIQSVRARLTLAKFENETYPTSDGHYLLISGNRTIGSNPPEDGTFTVAIGPKLQTDLQFQIGDLVRGSGEPLPETNRDICADLYRVRTLHRVARADERHITRPLDPPRTDPVLTPEVATLAHRRLLSPSLLAQSGSCSSCPYGTTVAVVRLSDPRDPKRGIWSKVCACLGPDDCPWYSRG